MLMQLLCDGFGKINDTSNAGKVINNFFLVID